ncbi:MAG: sugar phosphate isomerase/epimerase family protein [Bacteroidota bacterium]
MRIGMNMLLWTDHVTEQYFPLIEKLKLTGYEGIEVPLGDGDEAHYAAIGAFCDNLELGRTCVTSLLEETNIASPDAKIRAAGVDRLKWTIDQASALGAEIICGPIHSAFAYFTKQPPSEDEKKWSIEGLQKAAEYAAQANIVLTPEALNRFECYLCNTMAQIKEIVEGVNHPNVGAIYDTHHANIEEKSQKQAIELIAPYLKHVHVTENDRGTPGKGQINWDEVFRTLKAVGYDGWLTIEAFSTTIPAFANSINVWRDFSPADEVYLEGFRFIQQKWQSA